MGIDSALLSILERECASLGTSFVSSGGSASRITVQPSGLQIFAKLASPAEQVLGEGASLKAMSTALHRSGDGTGAASLVPRVHACGKASTGSKAYLVTDWLDMKHRLGKTSQRQLGERLALMHKEGVSKNGKFGFDCPTHCGVTEQDNTWTDSWTEFWADRRIGDLIRRIDENRSDPELVQLESKMREKVYPVLLSPLEGKIKPAILHGDLWSGNAGENAETGDPVIFESSYYGHNEAELGIMLMFGGFTAEFFDAYHKVIPRFEPHYDERIKLYELHHHLNHALMFGGSYRSGAVSIMRNLIEFASKAHM